jgi:hypothetical protein
LEEVTLLDILRGSIYTMPASLGHAGKFVT